MKTKAELQLAEQFEKAQAGLPGVGWVTAARQAAFRTFATAGLPHRRIEEWKYTDLRARMPEALAPVVNPAKTISAAALEAVLGSQLYALDCTRLVFVDGVLAPITFDGAAGLDVGSFARSIGQPDFAWAKAHFEMPGGGSNDAILALNTAFVTDGALLRIADGVVLPKPIHLVFIATSEKAAQVSTRNMIRVGARAKAVIFESHVATLDLGLQANAVTQVSIGDGAQLSHIKHLRQLSKSQHLSRWDVMLGEGATYRGFQLSVGSALVRNETRAGFTGPDAKFDLSGIFLGQGADHIDTTLVVNHSTPGCASRELFKGVLAGKARGVFQGKVVVQPVAQKTDGKQMAQVLMLSEDAEFDSKPELEIYADDVACGHGSTAAEIDPGMLFYLRSRGIPEAQARGLLIESFVGEAIEKIDHEGIREALRSVALEWLQALPTPATRSGTASKYMLSPAKRG